MSLVVPDFYPPSPNPVPIRPIPGVLPPDFPQTLLKELPKAIVRAIPEAVNRVLPKKKKTWLRDELEMRSVKILDMGYIAMLYFTFGVLATYLMDKLFGEWVLECEVRKSTFRIGVELLGMIWLFGVLTYGMRHLVEIIPSPMPNIPLSNPERKFDHGRMKELSNASVFTLILMGTSYHFRKKLEHFYHRITNRFSRADLISS
jgi:hypothetical protein